MKDLTNAKTEMAIQDAIVDLIKLINSFENDINVKIFFDFDNVDYVHHIKIKNVKNNKTIFESTWVC